MRPNKSAMGFSLIELLLVLVIIGIISAIAIPTLAGQRRRARVIGDAQSNAQNIRMQLETRRADTGRYGAGTYTWNATGTASDSSFIPSFTPKGNSKMTYSVAVGPLAYVITVTDLQTGQVAFQTNEKGETLQRLQ